MVCIWKINAIFSSLELKEKNHVGREVEQVIKSVAFQSDI
jgi:hypothetical protein